MLSVGSIIEIPWIFSINRDGRQRLPLRSYFPGAAKPRRGDRLADATLEFLKVFFLLATKGPPVMALMKSNKSSVIKCRGGASFGWGWGVGVGGHGFRSRSCFAKISEVRFDRRRVEGINNSKARSVNDTACGARDGSESWSACSGRLASHRIKNS